MKEQIDYPITFDRDRAEYPDLIMAFVCKEDDILVTSVNKMYTVMFARRFVPSIDLEVGDKISFSTTWKFKDKLIPNCVISVKR